MGKPAILKPVIDQGYRSMSYTDRLHDRISDWMPISAYTDVDFSKVIVEVPRKDVASAIRSIKLYLPLWLYGKPKLFFYDDAERTVRFTWTWPMFHERKARVQAIKDKALALKAAPVGVTHGA